MDHVKSAPEQFAKKIRIADQTVNSEFDYARYRQAIEAVVLRCLEKDPTQRYQSADELRLDLECLSENKIPKLPSKAKAIDAKFAKAGNFEGALALVVLMAILVLVLALKLLQPVI